MRAGDAGFAPLWLASVLVPLVGFAVAAWIAWTQVAAETRSRLSRTADMLHEHALRAFEAQNASLISATALIRERSWEEIRVSHSLYAVLAELDQATPATAGVALIAPDGKLALASRWMLPAPVIDLSKRDYVVTQRGASAAVPLTSSGTFVGEVSAGAVTGKPVFRLSRPRLGPNGMADGGVVSAAFLPAYFTSFWRSVTESRRDIVLLLRHDGAILARYPGIADPVGAHMPSGQLLEVVSTSVAQGELLRLRMEQGGNSRLVAIRRLGQFPVSVIYALDPGVSRADWLSRLPPPALTAVAAAALLLLLTARVQAAALRARREADLRTELEARLRRSEAGAAIGQLAAGVAHDFGNMAQAVAGGARMIKANLRDPERVQQLAALMTGQAERASRLASRMLGFARRGAADSNSDGPALTDIDTSLTDVVELLSQSLRADIRLRFEPSRPPRLFIAASRAELEAAVINLCVNARDALPTGGEIVVTASRVSIVPSEPHPSGLSPGDYTAIKVRDTGSGMDAATLARVGEPFFTTKPPGQGTGLGLSMARGFAVRAGGTLWIESSPGMGTTVTIWLPEGPAAAPSDATATRSRAKEWH